MEPLKLTAKYYFIIQLKQHLFPNVRVLEVRNLGGIYYLTEYCTHSPHSKYTDVS